MGKAYWLKGKTIYPLGEYSKHIDMILDHPELFGATEPELKAIYKKYDEPYGFEGKAREEIITSMYSKGWIRVRYYDKQGYWTIQFGKWDRTTKNIIFNFIYDKVEEKEIDSYDMIVLSGFKDNFVKKFRWKQHQEEKIFEGITKNKSKIGLQNLLEKQMLLEKSLHFFNYEVEEDKLHIEDIQNFYYLYFFYTYITNGISNNTIINSAYVKADLEILEEKLKQILYKFDPYIIGSLKFFIYLHNYEYGASGTENAYLLFFRNFFQSSDIFYENESLKHLYNKIIMITEDYGEFINTNLFEENYKETIISIVYDILDFLLFEAFKEEEFGENGFDFRNFFGDGMENVFKMFIDEITETAREKAYEEVQQDLIDSGDITPDMDDEEEREKILNFIFYYEVFLKMVEEQINDYFDDYDDLMQTIINKIINNLSSRGFDYENLVEKTNEAETVLENYFSAREKGLKEWCIAFDQYVHLEHNTGSIFDYIEHFGENFNMDYDDYSNFDMSRREINELHGDKFNKRLQSYWKQYLRQIPNETHLEVKQGLTRLEKIDLILNNPKNSYKEDELKGFEDYELDRMLKDLQKK